MDDLAIHDSTRQQIELVISNEPQSILIVGSKGVGKKTLAINLAETLLNISDFSNHPYTRLISSIDNKSIGIDEIRSLEKFLSLKVISKKNINRAVIIENAHLLSQEAQNSLLKTLEEPPKGTLIILTSTNKQALLPTIISRTQAILVTKPSKFELTTKIKPLKKDFEQIYAISGGQPGLMQALIDKENHPLIRATEFARDILQKKTYERLILIDKLVKDRDLMTDTLTIMQQMANISLSKLNNNKTAFWQKVLSASYEASESLSKNAQTKLVLTKLMLNL